MKRREFIGWLAAAGVSVALPIDIFDVFKGNIKVDDLGDDLQYTFTKDTYVRDAKIGSCHLLNTFFEKDCWLTINKTRKKLKILNCKIKGRSSIKFLNL